MSTTVYVSCSPTAIASTHTLLQSQLRNRLATELQKSLGPSSSASSTPTPVMGSMALQVANSIVAEHLRKARHEYSLSVFLPEAGVDSGKVSGWKSNLTCNWL